MAQAYAQQRRARIGAGGDQIEADPRLIGGARAGRQQESLRAGGERLPGGDGVVADDVHLRAQFHEIMDEVPGEAVIIVDDEDHRAALAKDRGRGKRSEEHTSELQSLMRISYAVFCLKKKKTKQNIQIEHDKHE